MSSKQSKQSKNKASIKADEPPKAPKAEDKWKVEISKNKEASPEKPTNPAGSQGSSDVIDGSHDGDLFTEKSAAKERVCMFRISKGFYTSHCS